MAVDHPRGHPPLAHPPFGHPLARAAFEEVTDLHAFFEAWLRGTLENTPSGLLRLEDALADGFTQVIPGGARLRRPDVIASLREAHGARAAPFRIVVRAPELLLLRPPLVVLGYVEEQSTGAAVTRRRSTAVFEACADGREGVRWLALHETWIAPGA